MCSKKRCLLIGLHEQALFNRPRAVVPQKAAANSTRSLAWRGLLDTREMVQANAGGRREETLGFARPPLALVWSRRSVLAVDPEKQTPPSDKMDLPRPSVLQQRLGVCKLAVALATRYLDGPGSAGATDQVFAQEDVSTGNVLWLLADNLGTTRDVVDNSGTLVARHIYNSFGQLVNGPTNVTRFL